jgi:hypothetical protein
MNRPVTVDIINTNGKERKTDHLNKFSDKGRRRGEYEMQGVITTADSQEVINKA